jgi:proteasome accessory factor B
VALVRVRPGRALLLRQRAVGVEPAGGPDDDSAPRDGSADGQADGQRWDVVHVVVRDVRELAQELAGYGPDVVAVEPADLREQVLRVLRGALRGSVAPGVPAGSPA